MARVTIKDIARASQVSIGTVSKVLNRDQTVQEKNRLAVEQAVKDLGYNVNKIARSLAHNPIKIGVMLPSVFETYFDPMQAGIRRVVDSLADFKVSAIYSSYAKFDDDRKIIECLNNFVEENVSGIILGPSHMGTYGSELARLQDNGIPVVLVLSDLDNAKKLACISIDSALSGKTAADLAGMVLDAGEMAAVFVGNKDVAEHRMKAESFSRRVAELGCRMAGVFETQDLSELAYQLTVNLIRQNPMLRLVYVATGNSVAVCRAICDYGAQERVKVIATDVLADLKPYTEAGVVIGALDQHFEAQGTAAVNTLYRYLTDGILDSRDLKIAPSLLLRSGILAQIGNKDGSSL